MRWGICLLFFLFLGCGERKPNPSPFALLFQKLHRLSFSEREPTIQLHLISVLSSERLARKWLSRYQKVKVVQGKKVIDFPRQREGVPVEPHPGQFLKVCQDGNLPRRLYSSVLESAYLSFRLQGVDWRRKLDWLLLVFAREGRKKWKNLYGETITLRQLGEKASLWLEELLSPVEEAWRKGEFFPKSEVHRWGCAGFHLFQGVLAFKPYMTESQKERLAHWIELFVYRLKKEPGLYWALVEKRKSKYKKLSLYLALWKFYSHFFEVFGWARQKGFWKMKEKEKKLFAKHFAIFQRILQWFLKEKIFENSKKWRQKFGVRFYRDLWNDACHAVRAWRFWRTDFQEVK